MSLATTLSYVTLAMLGGTLALASYAVRDRPDTLAFPLEGISRNLDGWTGVDDPLLSDRVLGALKPTSYVSRTYSRSGQYLGLFVAYYSQQRAGESMHSPKHCLPGSGWEILQMGTALIQAGNEKAEINEFQIENSGQKAVMLYWYQSRKRIIASEYLGKLLLIRDALTDGRTSGSIVRVVVADRPEAIAGGIRFASQILSEVGRSIGD
jgi:EpsI family protein